MPSVMLAPEKRALWLGFGRVRVWEAVALSFDVDPELVKQERRWSPHNIQFTSAEPRNTIFDYAIRLDHAERDAGERLKIAEEIPSDDGPGHKCMCRVRLSEYAAWLLSVGIQAPSWFPDPSSLRYAGRPVPADWDYWRHKKNCALWEAVALTLNVDPRAFQAFDVGTGSWAVVPRTGVRHDEDPRQLAERIEIALSNLGDGIEDLTPFAEGHRFRTEIRLPDFGLWAESIWPDLPQDFPRSTPARTQAVAAETIREGDGVTVRLPHLPRALSALFDIMRKHYDPKKPPKQTSVAAEIDKAMGWKAQKDGKPSRNADVLAAIIRPDSEADADPRASGRRRRS